MIILHEGVNLQVQGTGYHLAGCVMSASTTWISWNVNPLLNHGLHSLSLLMNSLFHSLDSALVGPRPVKKATGFADSKSAAILCCVVEFYETRSVLA